MSDSDEVLYRKIRTLWPLVVAYLNQLAAPLSFTPRAAIDTVRWFLARLEKEIT